MYRLLMLALCMAAGYAQTPADLFNKPPADVDQALRVRITEFFQDHVDGKYRQAEALVAEDTKDYFYNGSKPKYESFEIRDITYTEGYTRAKALVLCQQYLPIPEFIGKAVPVPTPSNWKLVDGQWYWYVDQSQLNQSPFGPLKAGPGTAAGPLTMPNPDEVLKKASQQVRADKTAVNLKPGGSDQVTLANGAPGVMTISLFSSIPGVTVTPDHLDLKSGEKAVLTFHAGNNAKAGLVTLRVEQTNATIPIQVGLP
ncbi:MAG TPA: hypothetical protein VLY24_02255 [Bryobacteraceae bacterium]|nr:hypothetical protein [Bryobacteraceae bacterium]